jgi:hypothetical protein
MNRSKLEQELANLLEIDVRPDLCDRVMERISIETTIEKSAPEPEFKARFPLVAQFLKHLSFVVAIVALVMGIQGTGWFFDILSFGVAYRLDKVLTSPDLAMSAGLSALACALFLIGFALTEGRRTRPALATRRLNTGTP